MKFKIGDKVHVKTFDIVGYGIITYIHENAFSILMDGYNEDMYFRDKEVFNITKNKINKI